MMYNTYWLSEETRVKMDRTFYISRSSTDLWIYENTSAFYQGFGEPSFRVILIRECISTNYKLETSKMHTLKKFANQYKYLAKICLNQNVSSKYF